MPLRKIVHIITGLPVGGAERALYNLLNGGLADNFDNHIISLSDEGTMGPLINELGVPVTALNMSGGRPSLSGVMKLRRLIRELKPDLIQGWMYHGNLAATLARSMTIERAALVWNVRHSLYDLKAEKIKTQQVIRLNRFFSSGPDVLLYNSQVSQKQHERFGLSSKQGQTIPNGIDIQKFTFSPEYRKKVRTQLGIPENALVVGHVARLHPLKDHSLFLKAAVDIASRNLNVHFLLIGRDVSMDNETVSQWVPFESSKRFHLLGERSDVSELMCAMDIFCLSSLSEAFPNVIGEAMATGLPCVATDVGDCKMIIGDTGLTVPPRSEKELLSGIEKLLTLSHKELRSLGRKARTRIEEKFALTAIVEQYTALYQRLIAEKRVR